MVDVGEALLQPLHEVPKFGGGEVLDQLPVDHRVGDELVEAPQHAGQVFDIDHVEADVVVATAVVEVGWGPSSWSFLLLAHGGGYGPVPGEIGDSLLGAGLVHDGLTVGRGGDEGGAGRVVERAGKPVREAV